MPKKIHPRVSQVNISSFKIRPLTAADVEFRLACEEEEESPAGHFASGDAEQDKENVREIIRGLQRGNQWAWCCAKVTAVWNGFEGSDYLGACNYESEEDFKAGEYYEQMKVDALAHLNDCLSKIFESISPLIEKK